MKLLARRLARLQARLPSPDPLVQQRLQQCEPIFQRWDQLLDAAWPLLSADERVRMHAALEQLHERQSGPYSSWFISLLVGWSRLPLLAPTVMKELLLVWLRPEVATAFVCRDCGLEYPFRYWPRNPEAERFTVWPEGGPPPREPEFFAACPHCGAPNTDILSSDAVEQHDYPWKHLDGYAGPDPRLCKQRR
jgi:hypothetical protein